MFTDTVTATAVPTNTASPTHTRTATRTATYSATAPPTPTVPPTASAPAGPIIVFPNPAAPDAVSIAFLHAPHGSRIEIYNVRGELLRTLFSIDGGRVDWDLKNTDGSRTATGAYVYVAIAGSFRQQGLFALE